MGINKFQYDLALLQFNSVNFNLFIKLGFLLGLNLLLLSLFYRKIVKSSKVLYILTDRHLIIKNREEIYGFDNVPFRIRFPVKNPALLSVFASSAHLP